MPWSRRCGSPGSSPATVAPATYTITVERRGRHDRASITFKAFLNTALETESHGGAANNTQATAQNLEGSFITLNTAGTSGQQPAHGAVLGALADNAGTLDDYYRFDLKSGQSATMALTGLSGGHVHLTLLRPHGHGPRARQPRRRGKRDQLIGNFFATRHRDLRPQSQRRRRCNLQPGRHPQHRLRHRSERLDRHGPGPHQPRGRRPAVGDRARDRRMPTCSTSEARRWTGR